MPDLDEKLRLFTEAILSDATTDSQAILAEVNRQREASVTNSEDDSLGAAYIYIKNEIARIHTENERRISRKQMEHRQLLHARRAELSEEVLRDARDKLANYVAQPAYTEQLTGMVREAANVFGGAPIVIGLRHEDMPLVPQLQQTVQHMNVSFVEDSFKLGGLTVECPAMRQCINRTFDASFSDWKERFFSEIVIS